MKYHIQMTRGGVTVIEGEVIEIIFHDEYPALVVNVKDREGNLVKDYGLAPGTWFYFEQIEPAAQDVVAHVRERVKQRHTKRNAYGSLT